LMQLGPGGIVAGAADPFELDGGLDWQAAASSATARTIAVSTAGGRGLGPRGRSGCLP
jgi:hypothetical protein